MRQTQPDLVLRAATLREGAQVPGSRVNAADQQRFIELLTEEPAVAMNATVQDFWLEGM
jgi:hypothetical protein